MTLRNLYVKFETLNMMSKENDFFFLSNINLDIDVTGHDVIKSQPNFWKLFESTCYFSNFPNLVESLDERSLPEQTSTCPWKKYLSKTGLFNVEKYCLKLKNIIVSFRKSGRKIFVVIFGILGKCFEILMLF